MASYGATVALVNQVSLQERKRSRKRIIVIAVSAIALVTVVIVIAVAATGNRSGNDGHRASTSPPNVAASVKAVCQTATYPGSCYDNLSPRINRSEPFDPDKLFQISLILSKREIRHALGLLYQLKSSGVGGAPLEAAVNSCMELLGMSMDFLNDTAAVPGWLTSPALAEDLRTWLSAAMTYVDTCLDGFENASPPIRSLVAGYLHNSTEFSSNSLSVLSFFINMTTSVKFHWRRLLQVDSAGAEGRLPSWMSVGDRKLLQGETGPIKTKANIVVAQDGSSMYRTISAAILAVPERSLQRTVIYVKKGVYEENVRVEKTKWNVMLVGDGKDVTTVTGSLNAVDSLINTFNTPTFAAFGKGFIARDMAFQNTAGAGKHQAVAMMSDSDLSAFYRCKFHGFQDTLYAHSLRQFYRECDIYGTVDFICGNAAVVLQNCNIYLSIPLPGQKVTITAQGKTEPKMNTGISIHQCTVVPFGDLSGVHVFLGRPWKPYSTTVYMKTFLPAIIDSAGWTPWVGTSAPDTIFYAEYLNTGPGADTANRVKWKGLRSLNPTTAVWFTAGSFLGGNSWLPQTGIPFVADL